MVASYEVIGIGCGGEDQLTLAAIEAMNRVDVFLVPDKGDATSDLRLLRRRLCERHMRHPHRLIEIPDADRGPDAQRTAQEYRAGVEAWHDRRVAAHLVAIDDLLRAGASDLHIGFLVWGDPAFYDSTLRLVTHLQQVHPAPVHVEPGVSAIQQLAASHSIVLNRIGKPVVITTGRRLLQDWPIGTRRPEADAVVMLNGRFPAEELKGHGIEIHWGAYLGSPHEMLVHGLVDDVADEIIDLRERGRAEHGWMMDIYLLRAPETPAGETQPGETPTS